MPLVPNGLVAMKAVVILRTKRCTFSHQRICKIFKIASSRKNVDPSFLRSDPNQFASLNPRDSTSEVDLDPGDTRRVVQMLETSFLRFLRCSFYLIIIVSSWISLSKIRDLSVEDNVSANDYPFLLNQKDPVAKATIAYAISITACKQDNGLLDGAAVLQHSIHLNSIRVPRKSKYDYKMFAFVHPEAINCTKPLQALGYEVQIRPTPIRVDDVRGTYKTIASKAGCCGEKEWLKLYVYLLTAYPVALHLDLDVLILQPLDDLYDAMLLGAPVQGNMWKDLPDHIDAFFTRDYNMIIPGQRPVHQIGVQGGFLVVRPNKQVFQEYVDIILEGNFTVAKGWGEMYGGYYGAATIQGLAAYYYGHVRPGTAVELNRCVYNNMADNPRGGGPENICRSAETECEDCRFTNLSLIKSVHYTDCYKPWKCTAGITTSSWKTGTKKQCLTFHHEWFRVRRSLESFWDVMATGAKPVVTEIPDRLDVSAVSGIERTLSYCVLEGRSKATYLPINIPQSLFGAL